VRPNKTDLIFDIKAKSGSAKRKKNGQDVMEDYTFEDQHIWLGWQARARIMEFLDETSADNTLALDVFAFDLDEPVVCDKLIRLAEEGRLRVLLDNSKTHAETDAFENKFEAFFNEKAKAPSAIFRGRFQSLAHSKVFIQKKKATNDAIKVLTGSTNFSTNGLYINANHLIIFSNRNVATLYAQVFDASFGADKMKNFHGTSFATQEGREFNESKTPEMTIRFSPHSKEAATKFFTAISDGVNHMKTDVLFAIMKDDSDSSILNAIKVVRDDKEDIFSYGITDTTKIITLYKPHTRRGVRVDGKGGAHVLPPPFNKEAPIPGIAMHHKFVVVDFRGKEPVLYCGSSNLAFNPEQKNGDNLLEIHDLDAVTVFAIEAIRLVDHFAFRDRTQNLKEVNLHAIEEVPWYTSYYDSEDLHFLERTLLIGERKT